MKCLPFQLHRPNQIPLQTEKIQMRRLIMSRLIWIYTVCHSVFYFLLIPLFATMDTSKFKDGRVQFTNTRVKRLSLQKWRLLPDCTDSQAASHGFVILKVPVTTAADNILFYFFFILFRVNRAWFFYRKNFVQTQKQVRISHGKWIIGVQAIEVRLYCNKNVTI